MTYSIVARDPETGELGVAVQTGTFGVGTGVPWAEAGVGAVATQSFTEHSYGPFGLDLMKAGRSAPGALAGLVASDSKQRFRQVGMVDAEGRSAAHTGDGCIGTLARRLLAALDAAEAEGGDFRGAQSAAILVVKGEATGFPWKGRVSNLRVDDHVDPLGELRRLLDREEDYRAHCPDHLPESEKIWLAAKQAADDGQPARARELLQPLFDRHPNWRDAVRAAGENGQLAGWEQILE